MKRYTSKEDLFFFLSKTEDYLSAEVWIQNYASVFWNEEKLPVEGTPFPDEIMELFTKYKLTRLLVQSKHAPTSSLKCNHDTKLWHEWLVPNHEQPQNENTNQTNSMVNTPVACQKRSHDEKPEPPQQQSHKIGRENQASIFPHNPTHGPAGVSISAQFLVVDVEGTNRSDQLNERFLQIIRFLSSTRIICVSTESVRHVEFNTVYEVNSSMKKVELVANIPVDVGSLCAESFHLFKTNLLPCQDRSGIFASGPSPHLLTGMANHPNNHDRSVFIDIRLSSALSINKQITIQQGVVYDVLLSKAMRKGEKVVLSLSDLIHHDGSGSPIISKTSQGTKSRDRLPLTQINNHGLNLNSLVVCPFTYSTRIHAIIPTEWLPQVAFPQDGGFSRKEQHYDREVKNTDASFISACGNGSSQRRPTRRTKITHSLPGGHVNVDLKNPWMTLNPSPAFTFEEETNNEGFFKISDTNDGGELSIERFARPFYGVSGPGIIHTILHNKLPSTHADVRVVDTYPRYVKATFQTLQVSLRRRHINEEQLLSNKTSQTAITQDIPLSLSHINIRTDGTVAIQHSVERLPPDSSLWISVHYELQNLNFESFPADPNRGLDLPPSIAAVSFYGGMEAVPNNTCHTWNQNTQLNKPTTTNVLTLFSSSVLIMPPVPDMSMPFNVIALTCTVLTFAVGLIMNFLVHKSTEHVKNRYLGTTPPSKFDSLKQKVLKTRKTLLAPLLLRCKYKK